VAGENEFRLRLAGGRRRFALSTPEHFKCEMLQNIFTLKML
jgi:hypothetical protein